MGRRTLVVGIVVGMVAAIGVLARPSSPQAAVPPERRVVMFTDSVGLGARSALPAAFPTGWSVHVDGEPARFVEQIEHDFVRPRLASDPAWFGDHVVIAAGYNYPYWDPERFVRSVDSLIDTLTAAGVEHVYWVTLREVHPDHVSPAAWRQVQPYYWYFPTVNDHLERALDRHANLRLVDWAAAADRPGLTYDAIHLDAEGAALYSSIVREAVEAAATSVGDGSITRVVVPDAAGAAAAAVNITTIDPRARGHLRVFDCDGEPPLAAVHSFRRDEIVAHAAIAPLAPDGAFCVFAKTATNLVIDVTGTFTDRIDALVPTRAADTRTSSGVVPAGATVAFRIADALAATPVADLPHAVALTATAVEPADAGWLRVTPCDAAATATTANVNHPAGASTPNLVIVEPDAHGEICVTARTHTHVVVDLLAAVPDPADASADAPARWFDSRDRGGRLPAGAITRLDVAALADAGLEVADGASVVLNVSGVDPVTAGYVTAFPCDADRPLAANLNVGAERVTSNAAIVGPGADGSICVYQRSAMHLVVDVMGTVAPTAFEPRVPERVLDTRTDH